MDNTRIGTLEASVIEALRRRLALSKLSQREAERALGMGHGALGKLLRGRTSLRFSHLELLAPVLGFAVDEILSEALGHPLPVNEPLHHRQ